MKKIIYKSEFSFHQKFILAVLFIIFTYNALGGYLSFIFGDHSDVSILMPLLKYIVFTFISILILLIYFSKKGLVIYDNQLYTARFIIGKMLYKKHVSLLDITDISILKFKGHQKYSFFSRGNPDLAYEIFLNEIYLLNEGHTVKNFLISTEDKELAEKSVQMIVETFHLNFGLYNPRF